MGGVFATKPWRRDHIVWIWTLTSVFGLCMGVLPHLMLQKAATLYTSPIAGIFRSSGTYLYRVQKHAISTAFFITLPLFSLVSILFRVVRSPSRSCCYCVMDDCPKAEKERALANGSLHATRGNVAICCLVLTDRPISRFEIWLCLPNILGFINESLIHDTSALMLCHVGNRYARGWHVWFAR